MLRRICKMGWTQAITVMGVNVAMIGVMTVFIVWAINKIDTDIRSVNNDVKSLAARLDGHAQRIDQLYKMFVDLLQERKK